MLGLIDLNPSIACLGSSYLDGSTGRFTCDPRYRTGDLREARWMVGPLHCLRVVYHLDEGLSPIDQKFGSYRHGKYKSR